MEGDEGELYDGLEEETTGCYEVEEKEGNKEDHVIVISCVDLLGIYRKERYRGYQCFGCGGGL